MLDYIWGGGPPGALTYTPMLHMLHSIYLYYILHIEYTLYTVYYIYYTLYTLPHLYPYANYTHIFCLLGNWALFV